MSWLCSWLIGLGLEISKYFKTFGIPGKLQYGLKCGRCFVSYTLGIIEKFDLLERLSSNYLRSTHFRFL